MLLPLVNAAMALMSVVTYRMQRARGVAEGEEGSRPDSPSHRTVALSDGESPSSDRGDACTSLNSFLFVTKTPGSTITALVVVSPIALLATVRACSLAHWRSPFLALLVVNLLLVIGAITRIVFSTAGTHRPLAHLTESACDDSLLGRVKFGLTGGMAWRPHTGPPLPPERWGSSHGGATIVDASSMDFHRRHKLLYQEYRAGRTWYLAVDVGLATLSTVFANVRVDSDRVCGAMQILVAATCIVACVARLALRPQIAPLPFAFAVVVNMLTVVGAVASLVPGAPLPR